MRGGPSGDAPADSLDLLLEEDRALVNLFRDWAAPAGRDPATAVKHAWDKGTFGMLVIEHAAIRLAAQEDIARVLGDLGQDGLADRLTRHTSAVRALLDRLSDQARGLSARDLAISEPFAHSIEELGRLIGADVASGQDESGRIRDALGEARSQLRTAAFVVKRSPTHPGPSKAWYDRVPFLAYLHTRFDRMDGYPGPHTPHQADTALADKYQPEG